MCVRELILGLALLMAAATGARAQGFEWIDGNFESTLTNNCATGSVEVLTQALIGYYGANDASYPYVGAPYYARVLLGTVGNPCTGGAQVSIDVLLPLATEPVLGNTDFRIRCFSFPLSQPDQLSEYTDGSCPTVPTWVGGNRYSYNPTVAPAWPVPSGYGLQIWFPVRSWTVLNGIGSGDNARFGGYLLSVDGNAQPESYPQQWVFVAPAPDAVFSNGFEPAGG